MTELNLFQSQTQSQIQTLSQRQIQALEMLSLSAEDLSELIYKEIEKNPALVITKDKLAEGVSSTSKKNKTDFTRTSSNSNSTESDKFQSALEAYADERVTLQEHLLEQLNASRISEVQRKIGQNLITNLDPRGFHILAPDSLLDKKDKKQTEKLLEKTLCLIQNFDPIGTCVTNVQESLLVQALSKENAPTLALFLLDEHFDFLNPPQEQKIVKKVQNFLKEQKKLFAVKENELYKNMEVTEEKAKEALTFIKTLNPFPAQNFGSSQINYILPDIYVENIPFELIEPSEIPSENFETGKIVCKTSAWLVHSTKDKIPSLAISPLFKKIKNENKKNLVEENNNVVSKSVNQAKSFIKLIEFRENTIQEAACMIVKVQHKFFEKGPGNLVPLKQKDISDALGVHVSTISRMANNKYLDCKWGLFQINYFFTNVATKTKETKDSQKNTAKEHVIYEIQNILAEHKDDKKNLSDQKLCDLLLKRGIKIARRTVTKYRLQLNIDSSYNR